MGAKTLTNDNRYSDMELILLAILVIALWALNLPKLLGISETTDLSESQTGFEYRTEFEDIDDEIAYLEAKNKHEGYPGVKVSPAGGLYRDRKDIMNDRLFQLRAKKMSDISDKISKLQKQEQINEIRDILNGVDETSDRELRAEGYDQRLINKARGISE